MKNSPFYNQARAMLNVLPFVMREQCFALKGGTAINFFVREMPRLSVDIDLTYLPIQDRETSLQEIGAALTRIAKNINSEMPQFKISEKKLKLIAINKSTGLKDKDGTEIFEGDIFLPSKGEFYSNYRPSFIYFDEFYSSFRLLADEDEDGFPLNKYVYSHLLIAGNVYENQHLIMFPDEEDPSCIDDYLVQEAKQMSKKSLK